MATVLSTTETELIGFQSQLCRVSYQSVPLLLLLYHLCSPHHSWPSPLLAIPFVSAAERKRCGTRDAPRTCPNLTDCRIGLARFIFWPWMRFMFASFSTRISELGAARRGSLLALKGVKGREQRQPVRGLIRDHRSRTDGRINKPSVMNESGSVWRAVGDRAAPLIVTSQSPSLPLLPRGRTY